MRLFPAFTRLSVISEFFALITLGLLLSACGGGGGSSNSTMTYTVGGTVSGLNGSLVLQNNGSDSLTISGNGSFSFASEVAEGSAYSLSVASQPVNQLCSIDNGSGTVSADISNITVTCETAVSYTVLGTVAGLNGTLTLQSTDGSSLILSSNADFSFDVRAAVGGTYIVSIGTQPTDQACVLTNGTGPQEGSIPDIVIVCGAPHTIGGTVSNLNGSLVLQGNFGAQISLTQNGVYTFPNSIPEGYTYNISVATQPINQQCTVSNRIATVSADVTDINVTCVDSYDIRASISGLNGRLSLYLNGSYAISTLQNGIETLATLEPGSNYSVYIQNQPSTQRCTLSNGSGTVTGTVNDISVVCVDRAYHDIGGMVSGLIGTVVLQNNGGDDISISSDASFNFATQIIDGGNYQVTVSSQPVGQVCSVSNGVGSVSAIVNDVAVVCGTPFSLGGTVSGLNGSLVLQNNNGNDLTINNNGGFTFGTAVANGSSYDVGVFSKPGPQKCEVVNGSGLVSGNISNVQVTCSDLINQQGQLGEGIPVDAVIQGSYAYVAANSGLLVLDISTPTSPVSVSFLDLPGYTGRVLVNGNYVYALGGVNLNIINISTPSSPSVAATYTGQVHNIVFSGGYAYFLTDTGFSVMDISNPLAPTEISSIPYNRSSTNGPIGMFMEANYVYVTDTLASLLRIIDVSNPASPTEVSTLAIVRANVLTKSGNYLYLAASSNGLYVVDVSDPTAPSNVGSLSVWSQSVEVSGNYAYVTTYSRGIAAIDISDPTTPVQVGSLSIAGSWSGRMALNGNYVYVMPTSVVGSDMTIIDISIPDTLTLAGAYHVNENYLATPSNMVVSGDYAYISDRAGMAVVSVADPTAPAHVSVYSTSLGEDLAMSGSYAYLAYSAGVQIVDVSNPSLPGLVGLLSGTGWIRGVALNGNYAYLADYLNGFRVVDISDPSAPVALSLLPIGYPEHVATVGAYAYVIDYLNILHLVNISDPNLPDEVSILPYINVRNVTASGGYVYLVTGSALHILDISNPAAPVEIGSVSSGGVDVAIAGNYAYLAADTNGLKIIDISNPLAPVEIASHPTIGNAQKVSVLGNHVYTSEYAFGLEIFETFLP